MEIPRNERILQHDLSFQVKPNNMTPSVNRATTRHSGPAPDARARADGDPLTEKRHDHGVPTVEEAAAVVLEQPRPGWRNAKHARGWPRTVCAPMRSRASERGCASGSVPR